MARTAGLLIAIVAMLVIATASQTAAQSTAADAKIVAETEKIRADIEKVRADTEKSRTDAQKVMIDALAGAKTSFGSTTTTTLENGAEALLLNRLAIQQAVDELGRVVTSKRAADKNAQMIIVIGSQPPGIGDWLSFVQTLKLLKQNLREASLDWAEAKKPDPPAQGMKPHFGPISVSTAITAATTIASLFRSDITLTGSAMTLDDQQLLTMLDAKFNPDADPANSGLAMIRSIATVTAQVDDLDAVYQHARTDYRDYLEQAPKDPKAPQGIRGVAGAKLATVIADYDGFVAALYKSVNGVSPAMALEFQSRLATGTAPPVLYIRSHKAALTLETRKNLGTGFGTVPTWARATATLAYSYVGVKRHSGVISCITGRTRITQISQNDSRTVSQRKREAKYPASCF